MAYVDNSEAMGGHKNTYDCIKAFSETDFTDDLKKFDVPTLVIHGDDDQIVPIDAAGAPVLHQGAVARLTSGRRSQRALSCARV